MSKQRFTFGFIGTFGPWHGINLLEAIIPTVIKQNENVHFLLIGDGILKQPLEKHFLKIGIQDQVTFTGKIPQDKAPEYLSYCDAFLCPTQPNVDGSRFFGSPTKLFEYMSMAKPIIASNLEQLADIISPAMRVMSKQPIVVTNQVGFLVDPLDLQGFIDTCNACMIMSDEQQMLMGANARKKVLENYTWQHHVADIIKHAGL